MNTMSSITYVYYVQVGQQQTAASSKLAYSLHLLSVSMANSLMAGVCYFVRKPVLLVSLLRMSSNGHVL